MNSQVFISAGDVSGDIHAAALVDRIRHRSPGAQIVSVGGSSLLLSSDTMLADTLKIDGFGFDRLWKKYRYFRNIFNKRIKPHFKRRPPDLVVLVDFYGFNIHVAACAKKRGIPVVYYISPQIWASRKYRIKKIRQYVDKVISIFPFEKAFYENYAVEAEYVGNPLVDIIAKAGASDTAGAFEKKHGEGERLVGLMPGSRASEVKKLLPVMLRSLELSGAHERASLIVFSTGLLEDALIEGICRDAGFGGRIEIVNGNSYRLRARLWFCLASSGTVTMENAILGIPTVIMYKLSWFSYMIAKCVVKVNFIGMPNILAEKEILPEYVQHIDERQVADTIVYWMTSPDELHRIRAALENLRETKIGAPGVIDRAADICVSMMP